MGSDAIRHFAPRRGAGDGLQNCRWSVWRWTGLTMPASGGRRYRRAIWGTRCRRCRIGSQAANVFRRWRFCAEAPRRGGRRHQEAIVRARGGFSRSVEKRATRWNGVPPGRCRCHTCCSRRGPPISSWSAREPKTLVDPSAAPDPSDLVMQAAAAGSLWYRPPMEWLDLRSVLVAWKDVREARRAVFDALPISGGGKRNHDCGNSRRGWASRRCVSGGCRRSSVAARPRDRGEHRCSRKGRRSDRAARQYRRQCRGGRVIAGAYGHSRFREWVLSGVTRHLATRSRRCAFLSR